MAPGARGPSPKPLTLPLPVKRRTSEPPSPRLFAWRGSVRGRAIGRTVSDTISILTVDEFQSGGPAVRRRRKRGSQTDRLEYL